MLKKHRGIFARNGYVFSDLSTELSLARCDQQFIDAEYKEEFGPVGHPERFVIGLLDHIDR